MKTANRNKKSNPNVPILFINELPKSQSDAPEVLKMANNDNGSQHSNEEVNSYLCDHSFSEASQETVSNSLSPEPLAVSPNLNNTLGSEEINFLPLKDPDQGVQYQMDLQNPGVMIYYEEQLNDREAVNVTINPMSNFKEDGLPFSSSPKNLEQNFSHGSHYDNYSSNSCQHEQMHTGDMKVERQQDESEVFDLTRIQQGLNDDRTLSGEESIDTGHEELERFPTKLWKAANDPNSEVIVWTPDGKSVEIEPSKFDREVMSKHPRLVQVNRFENMRRQMREYGFIWDEQQDGKFIFNHMFFRRGRKDLLRHVQTRRRRGLISGTKSFTQGEQPTPSKRGRKPGRGRKASTSLKPENENAKRLPPSKCNWTPNQSWYGEQYVYDNIYGNSAQAYYIYPTSGYGQYPTNYNNSPVTTSHNTISTTIQPVSELQQF